MVSPPGIFIGWCKHHYNQPCGISVIPPPKKPSIRYCSPVPIQPSDLGNHQSTTLFFFF